MAQQTCKHGGSGAFTNSLCANLGDGMEGSLCLGNDFTCSLGLAAGISGRIGRRWLGLRCVFTISSYRRKGNFKVVR